VEAFATTSNRRRWSSKVVSAVVAALVAVSAPALYAAVGSTAGAQRSARAPAVEVGNGPDPRPQLAAAALVDLTTFRPVAGERLSGQGLDTPQAAPPEFAATGFVSRWGRYTRIEVPGASGSVPAGPARLSGTTVGGTNDRGQIVGAYVRGGTSHGFMWDDGRYTTIDVPGAVSSALVDINNRGQMLGSYTDRQGRTHGFVRERGDRGGRARITTLDLAGAAITAPHRINDRGRITGSYTKREEVGLPVRTGHGFVWDDGRYTRFDVPFGGPLTDPAGINDRGVIVGAYDDDNGGTHGFLRTPRGRYRTIDVPGGGPLTSLLSVDDRGVIVGQYVEGATGAAHGFVLRDGQVTDVDLPGALLTVASDIDGRGAVVGFGYSPVPPQQAAT
jgi:hypothetical protein